MKDICFLSFLLLVACEPKVHLEIRPECDVATPEHRAWIIDCAKAANPMSDEEGEDLVIQCERTAVRLFCPRVLFAVYEGGWSYRCDQSNAPAPCRRKDAAP